MPKSLLLLAILALLLAGCGGDDTGETAQTDQAAPVAVTIAEFNASPDAYVDKTLELTGTVDHVCAHGGKRMFIMGDDPADRVKIESGKIPAFDADLAGSQVRVVAVARVETIDAAYLDAWEAEATVGEVAEACEHGGNAATEAPEAQQAAADAAAPEQAAEQAGEQENADLARIAQLRQQMAASGKDHIAFYHLECVSFEEL